MLSGEEILRQIELGNIVIEPFDKNCVSVNGYDVHLGEELVLYDTDVLESKKPTKTKTIKIPEEGYVLEPGVFYLSRTLEYTETRTLVPLLEGTFSVGSLGILIHVTAGFGDNGFQGTWTLEIGVIKPVRVYPRMKFGQIAYFPIEGDQGMKYQGKYLNQIDTKASEIYKDFKEE